MKLRFDFCKLSQEKSLRFPVAGLPYEIIFEQLLRSLFALWRWFMNRKRWMFWLIWTIHMMPLVILAVFSLWLWTRIDVI
jgi:hypothetical protein